MSAGRFDAREAAKIKKIVATFLTLGGGVLLNSASLAAFGRVRFVLGLTALLTGIGLWRCWRRARWMALGACFLALIAACAAPVALFLLRPFTGFNDLLVSNLVFCFGAFVGGLVAYRGLGYLRSDLGRREFAVNQQAEKQLMTESSAAVAYSAGVWISLSVVAASLGAVRPIQFFAGASSRGADAAVTEMRPQDMRPDFVPLGLCTRGTGAAQRISIAYANTGAAGSDLRIRITTGDDWQSGGLWHGTDFPAPAPGEFVTVDYEAAAQEARRRVLVGIDASDLVIELDEDNNRRLFEIRRDAQGRLTLPDCDSLRVPVVPKASRRFAPPPPDLLAIGLCRRGPNYLSFQYTNLGGPARGHFWISQGRAGEPLEVVDPVYLSVPPRGAVHGFNIGYLDELNGKPGGTVDLTVKLDAADTFAESNETNNMASARITRLANRNVDLPACEVVDELYYSMGEIGPDAISPVFVPLPDLVPLGLCEHDWGASKLIEVVYGNVGNVRRYDKFQILARYDGDPSRTVTKDSAGLPTPGYLTKEGMLLREEEAHGRLSVSIDSKNQIPELNEANNAAQFEIRRKPDGRLDMPDCESVKGRVSEWTANMISTEIE